MPVITEWERWVVLRDQLLRVKETRSDDPDAELMISFLVATRDLALAPEPSAVHLDLYLQVRAMALHSGEQGSVTGDTGGIHVWWRAYSFFFCYLFLFCWVVDEIHNARAVGAAVAVRGSFSWTTQCCNQTALPVSPKPLNETIIAEYRLKRGGGGRPSHCCWVNTFMLVTG